jgi:hypothetical protein
VWKKIGRVNMGKLDVFSVNVGKDFSASTIGCVNVWNIGFVNVLTLSPFHTHVSSMKI